MAKAKKGKTTKTTRSTKMGKTGKLPKTVAGIELPKEWRKQGAKLMDLVKNPLVGDLVAAGLVALAANVRSQSKSSADGTAEKKTAADGISKTAVTLATVVAARAAEKITSKLTERPAPPAKPETPETQLPAAATPGRTSPARRASASPRTALQPASDGAAVTPRRAPAPKKGSGTTRKSPAPRKPRTPKPGE